MNNKTVKANLIFVFLMREKAKKMYDLRRDAQVAEDEADKNVIEAKDFLRKSIEKNEEVYVANINGKDYKIMPDDEYKNKVIIEEINIIK